jgi:isopropylmalate/homocitrate/citramalate synthase
VNGLDLTYDWNKLPGSDFAPHGPVFLLDESLRDGLQSPSVRNPSVSEKLEILHLMEALGINFVDVGLPGAGPQAFEHCLAQAREIAASRMKIGACCAARTHENDIRPIAEISQKAGISVAVAMFLGSSPIRRYVEGWTDDFLLRTTEHSVRYGVSLGLEVAYVTEDTTRCDPEMIRRLYGTALSNGAKTIVVCDTAGHATPAGVRNLIRFILEDVIEPSGEHVRVDWHGHRDRGLGLANSFAALAAGAHCAHGCGLGLGERSGNTSMDQLLVNLKLMEVDPWGKQDMTRLKDYCAAISRATGVPIPGNYPVAGEDAFRTGTGVHAAAVIKALRRNDIQLADDVYSGVPAHDFGLEQIIEVGPMSGKSNIVYWLERRGVAASDDLVQRIFDLAKHSDRLLTVDQILACCSSGSSDAGTPA